MLRSSEKWLYGTDVIDPGRTHGERITAPVSPPPGPMTGPPPLGVFGYIGWPQHARASPEPPTSTSASSKGTTSIPPCLYAREARIRGTQALRSASADTRPPGRPSTHGLSCPSSHRFGVMKE